MITKPNRYKNGAFLAFVRTLNCCACDNLVHSGRGVDGIVEAHHVETRGAGGSDLKAIPLCRKHHSEIHMVGVDTFAKRHGMVYQELHYYLLNKFIMEAT